MILWFVLFDKGSGESNRLVAKKKKSLRRLKKRTGQGWDSNLLDTEPLGGHCTQGGVLWIKLPHLSGVL
jgi:hypothetical protein